MADSTQGPGGTIDASTLSQLMDGEWHGLDRSACVAGICDDAALRATWSRWHIVRDSLKGESLVVDASLCARIRAAIDEEDDYSNVVGIGAAANATAAPAFLRHADALPSGAAVQPLAPPRTALRRGAMGFGLAASVAVATVFSLQALRGGSGEQGGGQVADASAARALTTGGASEQAALASVIEIEQPAVVNVADSGQATFASPLLPEVELVGHAGRYWVSDSPGGTMQRSNSEARLNVFLSQHLEQSPSAGREGLLPYSRLVGYDERRAAGGR